VQEFDLLGWDSVLGSVSTIAKHYWAGSAGEKAGWFRLIQ
jgi:hypothetical protein